MSTLCRFVLRKSVKNKPGLSSLIFCPLSHLNIENDDESALVEWVFVCGEPFFWDHLDGPVFDHFPWLGLDNDVPFVQGLEDSLETAQGL